MEEIFKLLTFDKLKSVYREGKVDNRSESSAEHTWHAMVLADYFILKYNYDLDRLKIYELLMYHDVVEIYAGDYPLHLLTEDKKKEQAQKEKWAPERLKEELPNVIRNKFYEQYQIFEKLESKEAQFAKLMDKMEALIHEINYKDNWRGWTKSFTISTVEKFYFDTFPEVKELALEIIEYMDENDYFDEE